MGHRANYIIQSTYRLDIYYSHWRGEHVAKDMALGYRDLKEYIEQCEKRYSLLEYPWMEGCILIDESIRKVIFWEEKWSINKSIREAYIRYLESVWRGWTVVCARHGMLDIEQSLDSGYSEFQRLDKGACTFADFTEETNHAEKDQFIILKKGGAIRIWYFDMPVKEMGLLGASIIPILLNKEDGGFLLEGRTMDKYGMAIDMDTETLYFGRALARIEEALQSMWPGWNIIAGGFGYLDLLACLGQSFGEYAMSEADVYYHISSFLAEEDALDPNQVFSAIHQQHPLNYWNLNLNFFRHNPPDKSKSGRKWGRRKGK